MNLAKLPGWLIILLAALLPSKGIAQVESRLEEYDPPRELSGWEFRWGDSPFSSSGIPLWTTGVDPEAWTPANGLRSPEGEAQDFLWFRVQLPDTLGDEMALAARYVWMNVEVYVDSRLVYRSGSMEYSYSNRYNGFRLHLVPLPEDAAGSMLYMRISSGFENIIGIVPDYVYLGDENSLIQFAVRNDILTLIIGIIIVNIGAVIFLLLLLTKRERENRKILFYIALCSFCYGINYVCSHSITYLLVNNTAVLYYIQSLFLLFPVGLLGLFQSIVGEGYRSIIKWLKYLHLAVWLFSLGADAFGIKPYFAFSTLIFSLLAISLVAMIVTVIPAIKRGETESRIFGLGLVVAIVPGFIDTVFQGILISSDIPSLSPWGILFFLFILGVLLDRRFSSNTRQLKNAHKLLEAYSSSLEDRVRKRTEELSSKNDELKETLQDLKETQEQLVQSEKMASLGQLTAGIAHEIKNPLNFVNNFATLSIELADELKQAVAAGEDPRLILKDLKMNAANIAKHGQRADRIVKSMMEHARSSTRESRPVVFNDLIEEYVNLAFHGMRAQKNAFNVSIERSYGEEVGEVIVVPQEIGRVIINLCSNAFDAMREKIKVAGSDYKPTLRVETLRNGRFTEVHVKDNGTGIPEADRERVFEPFFTTKPAGGGTGLGLSISYDIVVQGHRGQFEIARTSEDGTEFVIRLPQGAPASK